MEIKKGGLTIKLFHFAATLMLLCGKLGGVGVAAH